MHGKAVSAWTLLLFVMLMHFANAANLIGFLIYSPSSESDDSQTNVVPFSDIFWQSPDGGLITTMSGSSASFNNAKIAKFIFLDESYWRTMNNNSNFKQFRAGILDREVVIPNERTDITSDNDIRPFLVGSQAIASVIKAAPDFDSTLSPLKAELDAEIAHYQNSERKVNDHWVSAKDYQSQSAATETAKENNLDIITLDGKTYKNASHINVGADTISFIYEDGGATVYLAMLPPDLQKRFNYDPKAREQQKLEEEKTKADAEAAAQAALVAQQTVVDTDIRNYARATSKSPLSGQVFIVTKGGENFKLGGIEILLFTKSEMEFLLNPKKEEAAKQLQAIDAQLKQMRQDYVNADAISANGQSIVENGTYIDPEKRKTDLQTSIDKLEAAEQVFASPDYYFADLPSPLSVTKTDADGKFTFTVPAGEYVVVAKGSRAVLDETEHYWWMVKFDMGEIARSIQLSNDNLSSAESDDSLIVTQ